MRDEMNERVKAELALIKKGIKKKCSACGRIYTCSNGFHAAICEARQQEERIDDI